MMAGKEKGQEKAPERTQADKAQSAPKTPKGAVAAELKGLADAPAQPSAQDGLWSQAGGALKLAQAAQAAAEAATRAARVDWALKAQLGREAVLGVDRLFFAQPGAREIELFRTSAQELARAPKTQMRQQDARDWEASLAGQVRRSVERAKGQDGSGS
jgi:hypothetical protein